MGLQPKHAKRIDHYQMIGSSAGHEHREQLTMVASLVVAGAAWRGFDDTHYPRWGVWARGMQVLLPQAENPVNTR